MSIMVISDHKETRLRKDADLPFVPHAGMDFFYRTKSATVKKVMYIELTGSFLVTFEDMEVEVNRYNEMIDVLKENDWTIEDQWKKK
jgi:hypothetical protein